MAINAEAAPQSAADQHEGFEHSASRQTITLPSFAPGRKTSRLEIDSTIPRDSDGSPGLPVEGQIHFFDGALQHYLNVNNPYLMGRMHNAILPFGGTAVRVLAQESPSTPAITSGWAARRTI